MHMILVYFNGNRCAYHYDGENVESDMDGLLGLSNHVGVSLPSQFVTKLGIRDVFGHCIYFKVPEGVEGYIVFGHYILSMSRGVAWVSTTVPSRTFM